jgi:hypothetical protein
MALFGPQFSTFIHITLDAVASRTEKYRTSLIGNLFSGDSLV